MIVGTGEAASRRRTREKNRAPKSAPEGTILVACAARIAMLGRGANAKRVAHHRQRPGGGCHPVEPAQRRTHMWCEVTQLECAEARLRGPGAELVAGGNVGDRPAGEPVRQQRLV